MSDGTCTQVKGYMVDKCAIKMGREGDYIRKKSPYGREIGERLGEKREKELL